MFELTKDRSDDSLDWLFELAGNYPLLDAREEAALDEAKWTAATSIQMEMIRDQHGARSLTLWAKNLLDNPPDLATMPNRQHYYLLRREQSPFLESDTLRDHLVTLSAARSGVTSRQQALEGLNMHPALAVGLAEVSLCMGDHHAMSTALRSWQTLWPARPDCDDKVRERLRKSGIPKLIGQYYEARNALVNHNLRLVFSIAAKHTGQLPYRDLIQEGTLGLIRAAEKYRGDKGYRFSTYAFNWIGQAIQRANEQLGGAVRFPAGVRARLSSIHREQAKFQKRHGYEPDRQTLAGLLDIELAELDRYLQMGDITVSLDSNSTRDPSSPALIERISGGPFKGPDHDAHSASLHNVFEERLSRLSSDEKRVIIRRWGLDGSVPCSRKETAQSMAVSTEWIRQLETTGLRKLKNDVVLQQVFQEQD